MRQKPFPPDTLEIDSYLRSDIANVYTVNPGTIILPLGESPPINPEELKVWSPVVILKIHSPYKIRNVRYASHKQNNPPHIPAPEDSGSFVYLGGTISIVNAPNITAVGNDWTVISDYTYIENGVYLKENGLILGTPVYAPHYTSIAFRESGISNPNELFGSLRKSGHHILVDHKNAVHYQFRNGIGSYVGGSFFPGYFFDSYLVNGGPPILQI